MVTTLRLRAEEQRAIEAGTFVRLELPHEAFTADGARFTSVLVGTTCEGDLRVFANVCRHQAIPLDARAPDPDSGVMTDDGRHLLCHAHGAIYRPSDGLCTSGPCMGAHLARVTARLEGDALVLE